MKKIADELNDFLNNIKDTDEYINYMHQKNQLNSDPELKLLVDDFRRRCFEIQMEHNYGFFNSYEKILSLKSENEELLSNKIVEDFLEAELKLSKALSLIYDTISTEIGFDIDFLEN